MTFRTRTFADTRLFGPRFLLPHGRGGEPSIRVARSRFGKLHYRPGQSDLASFRQVFGRREYDIRGFPQWEAIQRRYQDILDKGQAPFVLDAGGNVGAASVWFAQLLPDAHIVCVEPDADNARIARLNTGPYAKVTVVEAALGSRSGHVAVRPHPNGDAWAINTVRADTGVPIVTVKDCLATIEGGVPLIAKIDIEGFEHDLFALGTDWVDQFSAIFVEVHDWMKTNRHTSHSLQKTMFSRRREMLICGENLVFV